jgi:hypothetical protein
MPTEQENVKRALRALCQHVASARKAAEAMGVSHAAVALAAGKRLVSAEMALRIAGVARVRRPARRVATEVPSVWALLIRHVAALLGPCQFVDRRRRYSVPVSPVLVGAIGLVPDVAIGSLAGGEED